MLLKYVFIFVVCVNSAFAQMPNLKNNRANVPTDPEMVQKEPVKKRNIQQRDDGKIILGYGDIEISQTVGGQKVCHVTIKLKNSTIYPLNLLKVEFSWPSWKTPVTFSDFMVSQENFIKYRITGRSCLRIQEKPQIALTDCSIGNKTLQDCGKMIKLVTLSDF